MAVTFTWKVKNMEYRPSSDGLSNVVTAVRCWITGQSDIGTRVSNEVIFTLDTPDPANFVAYESLTESIVLGWTVDPLTELELGGYTASVYQQIDQIENPTELNGLPWDYTPIDADLEE